MKHPHGRIQYAPIVEEPDHRFKYRYDMTRPAGCAVCWTGCLSPQHFGAHHMYPDSWRWMENVTLLKNDTYLCDHDQNERERLLLALPRPVRIGSKQTIFTSKAHHGLGCRDILRIPGVPWFENFFLLPSKGQSGPATRDAFLGADHGSAVENPTIEVYGEGHGQPQFYIPVHNACLDVLDHFIDSERAVSQRRAAVDSIAGFYDAIISSLISWRAACRSRIDKDTYTEHGPNDWYDEQQFISRVGQRESHWFDIDTLFINGWNIDRDRYFFADPSRTGAYTETLLSDAPRLPDEHTSDESSRLSHILDKLPQELFDQILEELAPLEALSMTCDRRLPSKFWKELLNPRVFPFLWDLDPDLLFRTTDNIDWELLVRMLSQPKAFDLLPNVPRGLKNRHSIWRNLARLEAPSASDPPANSSEQEHQHANDDQEDEFAALIQNEPGYCTSIDVEWVKRNADWEGGYWAVNWRRLPLDD